MLNPSATGERPRQTQNGGSSEEGRGERRAFVARTSYSGQEVVSRPRNGEEGEERRNGGTKEGRKGGTLAAAAAAAPVIFLDAAPICASFLLLTDPVMPTRAGICSPKVYSPFQKTKKYSHSTCQLKGERNMYVKSTDGKLITLIQEWTVRTTVRTVTVSGKTHSPDTPSR